MLLRRRFVVALIAAVVVGTPLAVISLERRAPVAPSTSSVYPFKSAAVTALLAGLPTPTGFTRHACTQVVGNIDTTCFWRPRSVVPTPALMAALIERFGAKPDLTTSWIIGGTPSQCHPAETLAIQDARAPRLALGECHVVAKLGNQHLTIWLTSLVLADATSMVGTSRSTPTFPGGSTVSVSDVGSKN